MPEDFWDALVTGVWFADRNRPVANPVLASLWFDVLVAENGHLAVGAVLSDTVPCTRSTGAIATHTGTPAT